MTAPLDAPPTRAHDGRTMIGHSVVTRGADEHGTESVAVWQVDTAGASTGAWVVPAHDPAAVRGVLRQTARRALVVWDQAGTGFGPGEGPTVVLALPALLAEITTVRTALVKRVDEEREARRSIVPVEWQVEVPDPVPPTADALRRYAGLVLPPAAPVVAEALRTAALLRWAVRCWQETMTVLARRTTLRREFGPVRHLPESWESRLADAHEPG